MRRIAVNGGQSLVQPILGEVRRVVRHVESKAPQPWRTDQNEKRGNRLDSCLEVTQTLPNQIGAGQCVGHIHAREFRAERLPEGSDS